MSVDLEKSLAQLAGSVHDDATVERMTGQVHHMVSRIRRRRAARHTATGVVGVGAATAVAFGGVQLAGQPGTVAPPATTGAPSPSPSSLEDPEQACGMTLPQLGWVQSGPVELEPYDGAPTGRDDGGVNVSTHVVKNDDVDLSLEGPAPRFVAVDPETGRVAGVPLSEPEDWGDPDWAAAVEELGLDGEAAQMFMMSASMPLRDCDADPDAFGPETNLDDGTYDVYGMQVLHPEETYQGADTFVALGGPWPIAIDGAQGEDSAEPTGTAELSAEQREAQAQIDAWLASPVANPEGIMPRCGAEAVLDDGTTPLVLDSPLDDAALGSSDGTFQTTITMRTRDGQYVIGNAAGSGATFVLMKEGVVVGYQWLDAEDLTLVALQPDETLDIPLRGNRYLCGTGEGGTGPQLPLPPGTYQAVAVVDVMLKEVGVPGGAAESVTETVPVMSEPMEIQLQ